MKENTPHIPWDFSHLNNNTSLEPTQSWFASSNLTPPGCTVIGGGDVNQVGGESKAVEIAIQRGVILTKKRQMFFCGAGGGGPHLFARHRADRWYEAPFCQKNCRESVPLANAPQFTFSQKNTL